MSSGTIDIIIEGNLKYFRIKADFEIELMIKRLIPSYTTLPLKVKVHSDNTRIMRMISNEFNVKIKTNLWDQAIQQVTMRENITKKLKTLDYVEPDSASFIGELRPFQKQGLDYLLKTNGNTLIADEMGLGKTIEAIAYIATTKHMPVVVIAPVVTLINWKREIEKFLSLKNSAKFKQQFLFDDGQRKPIIHLIRTGIKNNKQSPLPPADFYLINYELVDKRVESILEMNPQTIVLDEIHSLRNIETKKYNACFALVNHPSVLHRIGLSGTPMYNKGIEMFNICEIISHGLFGDRNEFIRKYCMGWHHDMTEDSAKGTLAKKLSESIMIRRKKIDVLDDLPDKIRMKQTIPIDTSLYEKKLEELYIKIEAAKNDMGGLRDDGAKKEGLFQLNNRIREMRVKERQIAGIAKVPHIIEYMNNLLEDYDNEKFVIFCHHKIVHQALYDGLFQYEPLQVIGGQSDKERQNAIDQFQNNEHNRVIICGLRAGNVGINLTRAAYVIFAELDWTPSVHRQAEDRLHRIGQKNTVFSHYLEGTGTFDEMISDILLNKSLEISSVLGENMEHVDNKKAVEFLAKKFSPTKKSIISNLMS